MEFDGISDLRLGVMVLMWMAAVIAPTVIGLASLVASEIRLASAEARGRSR